MSTYHSQIILVVAAHTAAESVKLINVLKFNLDAYVL